MRYIYKYNRNKQQNVLNLQVTTHGFKPKDPLLHEYEMVCAEGFVKKQIKNKNQPC